ncbi:TetR/AcrR family transcriptional regulator [Mesorhizobium sp. Z1-4]|uniref:TetR/AcrR family transcriptional regulator n=1 Tax=Mesorhizobium sp. Z1-4 TaxID=2448478 RepID=UPI000FDA6435|nr:TetR/AcrR family transcriptional regulator [Mesorhizobium sp. Z1-4]
MTERAITASGATRLRIKSAALDLYAAKGLDGVTIRSLTEHANANMAAINYHFGSKDQLTFEIFRDIARKSAQARIAMLDELQAECAAAERTPKIREIIETFVAPYLDENDPRSGVLLAQLIMKHRAGPNAWTEAVVREELDGMALRYIGLLLEAAPHLTSKAVHWRYHLMVGGIVLALSDSASSNRLERLSGKAMAPQDIASKRREIVDFLVAGFGGD